jgi:Tfp pilus assembly protein PilP
VASAAKNNPAPTAKASAPAVQAKAAVAPTKAAVIPAKVALAKEPVSKPVAPASKPEPKQQAKAAPAAKVAAPAVSASAAAPTKTADAPKPKAEEKKWAMNGKRDPFFSPVVQTNGSGCATGKKCLEIGAINLRGVVKSDAGFIAVVTNNLNKAYFLRENDPVFNGYVVKITGDSVVFQETLQDKLGKPFTREVVKRIFTPAV